MMWVGVQVKISSYVPRIGAGGRDRRRVPQIFFGRISTARPTSSFPVTSAHPLLKIQRFLLPEAESWKPNS